MRNNGMDLPNLYPVGYAANPSFLYGIYRIVSETGCQNVLELGAGQSTLLLDALARKLDISVFTLENNEDWATWIGDKIEHEILVSPLEKRTIRNMEVLFYSYAPPDNDKYDIIIVDGPVGTRRYSRWGALEYIENFLNDEFVICFDDAERRGEQDTVLECISMLKHRNVDHKYVNGKKDQIYIFTEKYRNLLHI